MSLHEPKAPIVRIRKKKIKKKSKDNDIVHLPVRASQQARYSSLTTPPNLGNTKGRECCRHLFASCMKVGVCRLLCFRCILPPCYSGNGSDDEEGEVKDDGYHSQNRRSSEVSPPVAEGAHGGAEPQEVEMTEIKVDSGAPLIPPRNSVRINEYRRHGVRNNGTNGNTGMSGEGDIEVNYIEVESVSLSNVEATSNSSTIPHKPLSNKSSAASSRVVGYEEPLRVNLFECKMSVGQDKKCFVQNDSVKSGLSYSEWDNSDDSESKIYVNEDILKPVVDSIDTKEELVVDLPEDIQYINLENVVSDDEPHSTDKSEKKTDPVVTGHEYINLPAPETSECAKSSLENTDSNVVYSSSMSDLKLTVESGSEQQPKEMASVTHENDSDISEGETSSKGEKLKVAIENTDTDVGSAVKPEVDSCECNEDSSVFPKDKIKLIEKVSLPVKADNSDSSDDNDDVDATTSSDQAKLL